MIDFFGFYMWMIFGLVILAFIGFLLSLTRQPEDKSTKESKTKKA